MKVIILADIHGNLPALKRALEEADREGYDRLLHAGDLVGFGPRPAEVIDLLASRGIEGVRGNHDEIVASGEEGIEPRLMDETLSDLAAETLAWTRERLSTSARRYLADLPFERRLSGGSETISICHANPFDLSTYVLPEARDPLLEEHAAAARADLLALGHSHRTGIRELGPRRVVWCGSVGAPRDGDPRAGYAAVWLDARIRVEHRRFRYDVEKTVQEALQAGFAESLAGIFRSGR